MSGEVTYLSFPTDTKPFARTITEIRLRDDAQPSDFRVPLPGTKDQRSPSRRIARSILSARRTRLSREEATNAAAERP
jgi:hypothetical protein